MKLADTETSYPKGATHIGFTEDGPEGYRRYELERTWDRLASNFTDRQGRFWVQTSKLSRIREGEPFDTANALTERYAKRNGLFSAGYIYETDHNAPPDEPGTPVSTDTEGMGERLDNLRWAAHHLKAKAEKITSHSSVARLIATAEDAQELGLELDYFYSWLEDEIDAALYHTELGYLRSAIDSIQSIPDRIQRFGHSQHYPEVAHTDILSLGVSVAMSLQDPCEGLGLIDVLHRFYTILGVLKQEDGDEEHEPESGKWIPVGSRYAGGEGAASW